MKRSSMIFLLFVSGIPTAGLGQVQRQNLPPSSQSLLRAGDGYQNRTRTDGNDWHLRDENFRECLKHRKTGRLVCLTRHEWEDVASGKRDYDGKHRNQPSDNR